MPPPNSSGPPDSKPPAMSAKLAERRARQAEALRANLRRRKVPLPAADGETSPDAEGRGGVAGKSPKSPDG